MMTATATAMADCQLQHQLSPRQGSGAGGVNCWWSWGLALGARAAAKNDWRPWKWEVDRHGGGIYYGREMRWG